MLQKFTNSRKAQIISLLIGTAVMSLALAFLLVPKLAQMTDALKNVSWGTALLLAALAAIALLFRADASRVCWRAAGARLHWTEVHGASATMFVVSIISAAAGSWLRIAALRTLVPERAPRVTQLAAADAPIIAVEAVLAATLLIPASFALKLPFWVPVLAWAAVTAAFAAIFWSRKKLGHRLFVTGLAVFDNHRLMAHIVGLMVATFILQILRLYLALEAVGLSVSPSQAVLAFVVSGVLGILPIGPTTATAASVIVFGSANLAAAGAAGLVVTATGAFAAVGYGILAAIALGPRWWSRRKQRQQEKTNPETVALPTITDVTSLSPSSSETSSTSSSATPETSSVDSRAWLRWGRAGRCARTLSFGLLLLAPVKGADLAAFVILGKPRRREQHVHVLRDGLRWDLDLSEDMHRLVFLDLYERTARKLLMPLLQSNEGVVVDVGANFGFWSLHAAQAGHHVHAFEPAAFVADRLQRHLDENGLADNVVVHREAVSDTPGVLDLVTPENETGLASLHGTSGTAVQVPVVTLDDTLATLNEPIALLKVDVEGHELGVLEGAGRLFARNPPKFVFIELVHSHLVRAGSDERTITALLENHGYRLCNWIEEGHELWPSNQPSTVLPEGPLQGNALWEHVGSEGSS